MVSRRCPRCDGACGCRRQQDHLNASGATCFLAPAGWPDRRQSRCNDGHSGRRPLAPMIGRTVARSLRGQRCPGATIEVPGSGNTALFHGILPRLRDAYCSTDGVRIIDRSSSLSFSVCWRWRASPQRRRRLRGGASERAGYAGDGGAGGERGRRVCSGPDRDRGSGSRCQPHAPAEAPDSADRRLQRDESQRQRQAVSDGAGQGAGGVIDASSDLPPPATAPVVPAEAARRAEAPASRPPRHSRRSSSAAPVTVFSG
jgi:hypothetical protein